MGHACRTAIGILAAAMAAQLVGSSLMAATWYVDFDGGSDHQSGGAAGHYWYASSGWQDRTQRLYELAGEVTRKLSEK